MNIFGQTKSLVCATLFAVGFAIPAMATPVVYMTGSGNPWGVSSGSAGSNETAMNTAFGAGNWSKSQGFSMAAFAADTKFLYLDGSDNQASQLSAFLDINMTALSTYVTNGGTMILNAAPNQGGSFSMGFGATLNYPRSASSVTATSAGLATGIFAGIPTTYTGGSFSHASVTGSVDYISLLKDGNGNSVFGVQKVGNGMVGFGGMTLPNFHSTGGSQLLANMFTYVAAQEHVSEVPEPGSMALIGLGLVGAALARRRSKA